MINLQFCSFMLKDGDRAVYPGRIMGDVIEMLDAPTLTDVIRLNREAEPLENIKMSEARLVAPIQKPSKIICIGLNYREHIKEFGHQFPAEPVLFSKPSSAIIGPGDEISLPEASHQVDYEGEVAMVVARPARYVEDPSSYIFGYTCFNDVTARDIQKRSSDWTRAKGFDTFAPMGPIISTDRPSWLRTHLNDRLVQQTSTSDMIFGFDELIVNISRVMTLNPGDVIATGTPCGVGKLVPSDGIVVESEGIGRLENTVGKTK